MIPEQHRHKQVDFSRVFQGMGAGKPVLILGNGWSVNAYPKELYEEFITIGVNQIYFLDGFHPTVYLSPDEYCWFTHPQYIHGLKSIKIGSTRDVCYDLADYLITMTQNELKRFTDGPGYLWSIGTCVCFCIHLASLITTGPVLLLGCDGYDGTHPYYFCEDHPDFETNWNFQFDYEGQATYQSELMAKNYLDIKAATDAAGIELINVSPISTYDMFPIRALTEFVPS